MLEDTFESMEDQEEMEEEAEMEIDKILFEITAGMTLTFIPSHLLLWPFFLHSLNQLVAFSLGYNFLTSTFLILDCASYFLKNKYIIYKHLF